MPDNNIKNLLTNYDSTLLDMAEVEGESWLEEQLKSEPCDTNARGALEHLVKNKDYYAPQCSTKEEKEELGSVSEIYGSGGSTRWYVMGDGEVRYSEMHSLSMPGKLKRAQELGFELY